MLIEESGAGDADASPCQPPRRQLRLQLAIMGLLNTTAGPHGSDIH